LSPKTLKVFERIQKIHGKNLCVHRKDAKGLLAYLLIRQNNKTEHISVNNVQNENFLDPYFLYNISAYGIYRNSVLFNKMFTQAGKVVYLLARYL
jgi:hypothetical protein